MEIHLDSRSEQLVTQQLREGRYRSAEEVVARALEMLIGNGTNHLDDSRRTAVEDMLEFSAKHGFTLGEGLQLKDLLHQGHRF